MKKNDVVIMPKELGKDKSLDGNIKTKNIEDQLEELIKFNKIIKNE